MLSNAPQALRNWNPLGVVVREEFRAAVSEWEEDF